MSIFVATETGTLTIGEDQYQICAHSTRVREGHPLLKQYPELFEPAEDHVDYEWERATAAPGEKRGQSTAKAEQALAKMVADAVDDEIEQE